MTLVLDPEGLDYLVMQRPSYKSMTPSQAGERMQEEVDQLIRKAGWLKHLSSETPNVLDIGAGVGFGTLALFQHLKGAGQFYILDKSERPTSKTIFYGFQPEACAYNSLEVTRRFLLGAGLQSEQLHISDAGQPGAFPKNVIFDLVMAHISWGFHFPVATYLQEVIDATGPNSLVYLDIRKGTDGVERMSEAFELVWKAEGSKNISTVWAKRSSGGQKIGGAASTTTREE